jgi:hypothetical protein
LDYENACEAWFLVCKTEGSNRWNLHEGRLTDDDRTPKSIREVEAEGVTYILLSVLNLPGAEFSRGYIQHWGAEISEKSSRRILTAADRVLKAGIDHSHPVQPDTFVSETGGYFQLSAKRCDDSPQG